MLIGRGVSALMGVGVVYLVYRATRIMTGDPRAALLAACVVAFNTEFVLFAHLGNTDVPALFWLAAALVCFARLRAQWPAGTARFSVSPPPWPSRVVYCLSGSTAPFGEKITAAGVKVRALPRNGRFELSRALDLARHARRDRIDILHAFLVHASGYAWVAKRLARVPRLITSARNCPPMGALQDRLISRVFRSSDAIVCNAEAVRTFVQRQYAAPRERCHVIHNGVDLARFSLASDVGHAPTVMTAGRLVAQKDLGLFLEAAALLIRECPATRFLIAGDGPALPVDRPLRR
jgi:glycosyltransferase involved in cell wall biosynthesis